MRRTLWVRRILYYIQYTKYYIQFVLLRITTLAICFVCENLIDR